MGHMKVKTEEEFCEPLQHQHREACGPFALGTENDLDVAVTARGLLTLFLSVTSWRSSNTNESQSSQTTFLSVANMKFRYTNEHQIRPHLCSV